MKNTISEVNGWEIGRRDLFRAAGFAGAALLTSSIIPKLVKTAYAEEPLIQPSAYQEPGSFDHCRMAIFGADSLGIENSLILRNQGAPGLNVLNPPFCSVSDGLSVTQPGWATILTGLPIGHTGALTNRKYERVPNKYHIFARLMEEYNGRDLYIVWVAGKGKQITGFNPNRGKNGKKGPHYSVYKAIKLDQSQQGIYEADVKRDYYTSNQQVFDLATAPNGLPEAITHENFLAFIHFEHPDRIGHISKDYNTYMQSALDVDDYISQMISMLPDGTDILYCSDHDFHFKSQGWPESRHKFAPFGMAATNVATLDEPIVPQTSLGRFIYRRAGGNPNYIYNKPEGSLRAFNMYGLDLV